MAYGGILGKSTTTWTNSQIMSTATAALFGLGADAVPDDVLEIVRSLITTAQNTANTANTTANSKATLVYGSYIGKGTYGSSNKNSLTFSSRPSLLIIRSKITDGRRNTGTTFIYSSTVGIDDFSGSNMLTVSWGSTVSWYNIHNASSQLNESGTIYYYAAIIK